MLSNIQNRHKNRETDGQTDRHTNRQKESQILIQIVIFRANCFLLSLVAVTFKDVVLV